MSRHAWMPWKPRMSMEPPDPRWWGLQRREGRLFMEEVDLVELAQGNGTPLHVVSAARLRLRARQLLDAFRSYEGGVSVHYSYKTNSVSSVLRVLHEEGLGAEVVDGYELYLARRLGVPGERIVFNGPNKREAELAQALDDGVGLVVADHLAELERLDWLARHRGVVAPVALRVCPDIVPAHMNASSLTGSRKNQFGLDLPGGEVAAALQQVRRSEHLRLRGVMAHIGSGIHDLSAFTRAVDPLLDVLAEARALGLRPDLLDLGGGLGTALSRELTTVEMLAYLGTGHLPGLEPTPGDDLVARYAAGLTAAVREGCGSRALPLPRLLLEPGRALVSDAQVLLLQVGHVRDRPGVGAFALVDGGAMTVSMMFLSELHAVLLANREGGNPGRVSVFGALPSPMDVVYRNLWLPSLRPGDLLAVMDAGAYFTSTATNFGGPRPGVLMVDGDRAEWARRPETYDDLVALERDLAPVVLPGLQPKVTAS